jgi:SAM-dependent methyltransferase
VISKKLFAYWYPDQENDGTLMFYSWVREHTGHQNSVLNVGAGPATGNPVRRLRGEVARVVGVDTDPIVLTNDELDESLVIDGSRLPFDDRLFDVVLSDFVLEHVEYPEEFLEEIFRVLRPRGSFFFRTPNRYHYVSLLARHTPHWVHDLVANRARGLPSGSHKPYPTFYRLNTVRKIEELAKKVGFSQIDLRYVECEPSYLVFSAIPFFMGVMYERTVNKFKSLAWMRANIFGRLVR